MQKRGEFDIEAAEETPPPHFAQSEWHLRQTPLDIVKPSFVSQASLLMHFASSSRT